MSDPQTFEAIASHERVNSAYRIYYKGQLVAARSDLRAACLALESAFTARAAALARAGISDNAPLDEIYDLDFSVARCAFDLALAKIAVAQYGMVRAGGTPNA